jgi:3-deoxy-D-manno-octulosonic-acid transferase
MSQDSFDHWQMARGMAETLLGAFSLIFTQTEVDAAHFKSLGANHVAVTDNIKYSAVPLPYDETALSALRLATDTRPLWVYASTHAGEESLACRIHKRLKETLPNLLTIIVPRHPERRENIAGACFEHEVKYRLRGETHILPAPDDDIYIADTMGELGLFYSLTPIAMIGRSFSDDGGGGHNPLEAAQLGCAVLTGPNNQNQRQLYDDMKDAAAVAQAQTEEELFAILRELLTEKHALESQQRRTANFVKQKEHIIDGVMEKLRPLLQALENRNAA